MNWSKYIQAIFKARIEDLNDEMVDIYFPIAEGKQYGGAIMADAISQCQKDSPNNFEIMSFSTLFYLPTNENTHNIQIDVKKGRNFNFKNVYFYSDESMKTLTSMTNVLLGKIDESDQIIPTIILKPNLLKEDMNGDGVKEKMEISFNNMKKFQMNENSQKEINGNMKESIDYSFKNMDKVQMNGNIEDLIKDIKYIQVNRNDQKENPIVVRGFEIFDRKIYKRTDFYQYIEKVFKLIEKNKNDFNIFIKKSAVISFLKFVTTVFDLKIENEFPLRISYSIDDSVPISDIVCHLTYMIDILMVCYASIHDSIPIYDSTKIVISSVEHQMKFLQKIGETHRTGIVEFSNNHFMRRGDLFFINAQISGLNGEIFCQVSQLLYLLSLNKSKL